MKPKQNEFLKILSSYQGIIHKVNLIYFKNPTDREDNFQDIVYQLWKAYPCLKDKNKIGSWMYRIAINTSISKLRKENKLVIMETVPDISIEYSVENLDSNLDLMRLVEALRILSEIDQSVMLLYLENYNYEEIGEILGITPVNVGVKINRAKKQLRKFLNN